MNPDIRNDLCGAADARAVCETLRRRCAPFGTVRSIDVLPLPRSNRKAVACIVDMETSEQASAAQVGLSLASFGPRTLVCVVEAPRFSLAFPFHYLGQRRPRAA